MSTLKWIVEEFKKASTITKGVIVFIILLIIAIIMANVHADKEEEERLKREAEAAAAAGAARKEVGEIDIDAELQAAYVKAWGEAPVGFKWQADGSLIAISDNATTAEDTAWYFLRGLSILDFSTAEKYNKSSTVIDTYDDFYNTTSSLNYYTQFLRKMYKECLTSIEINKIVDSAVFADGDRIVTFSINVLDLTDKDFWIKDQETIFNTLRSYYANEEDGTKASQYLYDYVLAYYESDAAKKRPVQIDIRLEKQTNSGWLVTDDMALNIVCEHEYGVNAVEYIKKAYEAWMLGQTVEEYKEKQDKNEIEDATVESITNPNEEGIETESKYDENGNLIEESNNENGENTSENITENVESSNNSSENTSTDSKETTGEAGKTETQSNTTTETGKDKNDSDSKVVDFNAMTPEEIHNMVEQSGTNVQNSSGAIENAIVIPEN